MPLVAPVDDLLGYIAADAPHGKTMTEARLLPILTIAESISGMLDPPRSRELAKRTKIFLGLRTHKCAAIRRKSEAVLLNCADFSERANAERCAFVCRGIINAERVYVRTLCAHPFPAGVQQPLLLSDSIIKVHSETFYYP